MNEHMKNDPPGPLESSGLPEVPAATRQWLAGLLARERDSVIWPLVPVADDSIGSGLAARDTIAVRVQAGWDRDSGQPIVYPATLTRRSGAAGEIELTLAFDEPPAGDMRPYALTVGKLDLWSFEPLSLGSLADPTAPLAEPTVELTAPTVDLAKPEPGLLGDAPVVCAGGLAAAGELGQVLHASHERLDLHWSDGFLEVRVAQPPRRRGQPVVVETTLRDVWGGTLTVRDVVTVDERIADGQFAGCMMGGIPRREPYHFELDQLRITVRPLRADDLSLLNSLQIDSLLAGQNLKVLTTRAEGFELRAAAVWNDQQHAVSASDSTWLVRVATGKEVR